MPSIYIPHQSAAFLAQKQKLDNGLRELCELNRPAPWSQGEIARHCGVSQQRVKQIEDAARKKLVSGLEERGVRRNCFTQYRSFS